MRRPRLRLRTMLVVVAVVAVGLWLTPRWLSFRERAAYHDWCEAGSRAYASDHAGDPSTLARQAVERGETLAVYHAHLKRKYEHAAARPWLPVEPDPPEP